MKETAPVYVLIRTSSRPEFFKRAYESVKNQTYKHIITIVHYDNFDDLQYIEGDIKIFSPRKECHGPGHYNLYCNKLLENIPDSADRSGGWYHFLDDDDMYTAPDVIERLVNAADENAVNVGRSKRAEGVIYPKKWKGQNSFQTECFFLHVKHRKSATWWNKRGGDHHYSSQLTANLPINWIDDLIICEAQAGKGFGRCLDLNEQKKFYRHQQISKCGARFNHMDHYLVEYLENVPGHSRVCGKAGEQRWIHKDYYNVLFTDGKVKKIKEWIDDADELLQKQQAKQDAKKILIIK